MPITKWVKSVVEKIKENLHCDHTVGMYHDYADTDLVLESELVTDAERRWENYYVGDVSFFYYCPDCGERLPHKEMYEDAVEMV
jgi:hypothetical protein